jgi:hypothetical protein
MKTLRFIATFFVLAAVGLAQDAVPGEILNRTLFIRAGGTGTDCAPCGTGFVIDYQGKAYLVTARHVVAGLPTVNATIQVMKAGNWVDYHTVKTLFPPSPDADVAVFETSEKVPPYEISTVGKDKDEGVTMGQQIWFLGYPGGLGSHWSNGDAPFIKKGVMSAIDARNPDTMVLYIDGFNNPGFSGGPIIYWDFKKHAYKILGVVSAYREEAAKVRINGKEVDTQLLVNSGILIGYPVENAIKAIEGK